MAGVTYFIASNGPSQQIWRTDGTTAGSGSLTMNMGAATLTLSGTNTYTGLTTITSGSSKSTIPPSQIASASAA